MTMFGKDIQKLSTDLSSFAPETGIPRLNEKLIFRAKNLKEQLGNKQPTDGDVLKFTTLRNQITTDFQNLRDRLNNST